MLPSLIILIPVLHRPHRVEPMLETTAGYSVLFLATKNDGQEITELRRLNADYLVIGPNQVGDYAKKINLGVRETKEDLIFLGADDLNFHSGWFENACKRLQPSIGVVGTNDLGNPSVIAGHHATHSLVTRSYIENFGTIDERGKALHEGYVHEYVDNELVMTAKKRRAWAFAKDSIVEHLHPNWGKAPNDSLYMMQRQRMNLGRQLFIRRQRLWM
jgi:hypothetical protein